MELQRQCDALEEQEKHLKKSLTELMKSQKVLKVQGTFCDVEIDEAGVVPTPRNWELIYKYIQENNAFDLLQRRLSNAGIQARWDEGIEHIPGVDKFPVTKFKVTNRKAPV